jgi:hypothetical protein
MIFDDPNRAVKRAIMVAKGLGRAIGPLPGDRAPYSAAMPMLAGGGAVGQHPASMGPGVHVSGSPMGFASGGDVEPANETGFDAWHGTPHEFPAERLIQHPTGQQEHVLASQPMPAGASVLKDFPLGRFRSDKIGTGEGAQTYGHGLYFGEEPTARGYRQALSGDPITNKGEKPNWQNRGSKSFAQLALAQSLDKKLSGNEAIKDAMQDLHRNAAFSERKDIKQRYYDAVNSLGEMLGKPWKINFGNIYHVRVNANPKHFLDWDKPLSEQSEHVQKALEKFGFKADPAAMQAYDNALLAALYGSAPESGIPRQPSDPTGGEIHQKLVGGDSEWGKSKQGAIKTTKDLHAAGIPGIRYLDAGSRGPTGSPTYNHVIFDPSIIDIKRRYKRGGEVVNTQKNPVLHHAMSLTNPGKYATNAVNITKTLLKRP